MKRLIPTPLMHRVVEDGELVFVGGTITDDPALDMEGQARNVFAKIDGYLTAAGSDRGKILSATIFVTDLSQKAAMNKVWQEWLSPGDMPARATLGVSDLGKNVLIEVTIIARK